MTGFAQGGVGLALVLSFVLLLARRPATAATACAAQTGIVAVIAMAQGEVWLAGGELAEAVILLWVAKSAAPTSLRFAAHGNPAAIVFAVGLAGLCASVAGAGAPLAVVLLGALTLALPRPLLQQTVGVVAMQNGLLLAALGNGVSGWSLRLIALPILPVLAITMFWFCADRERAFRVLSTPVLARFEAGLMAIIFLLAIVLLRWSGVNGPFGPFDLLSAYTILLITAMAVAFTWSERNLPHVPGGRLLMVCGAGFALLSRAPLGIWLGMAVASAGAVATILPQRAYAWRSLCMAITGLGLSLAGTIIGFENLCGVVCLIVGYGVLAGLTPELAIASVVILFRLRHPQAMPLLMMVGLAALMLGAASFPGDASRRVAVTPAVFAQAGVAVFAIGLGTQDADFAAVCQLTLLALIACARALAHPGGADAAVAAAGLTGLPPFGLFPSLALIVAATAAVRPWLLVPLGLGLGATAWPVLMTLPVPRGLRPSLAWVPLVLAALAGFAMPQEVAALLRLTVQ